MHKAQFRLHPQLAKDCIRIGRFPLCHLLMMNDATYPWFILVPEVGGVREIYELSETDQGQLMRESVHLAGRLAKAFAADKMNIAALGNVVPQLHIHHIVRFRNDPAWPAPVWGKTAARPYDEAEVEAMRMRMVDVLGGGFEQAPPAGSAPT